MDRNVDRAKPPVALWVHAALVVAAAAVMAGAPGAGWVWLTLVGIAFIQASLLGGSRFAWWVEVIVVALALDGLYDAYQRVGISGVDLSTFFDPARSAVAALLLSGAGVALLLPSARTYASRGPRFEMTAGRWVLFAAGATFAASIPVEMLSAAERLPSEGTLELAKGATFVAGEPNAGVAFYARESSDHICLVQVARSGAGSSCDDVLSHFPPNTGSTNDDFSGIVDKKVVRVWIRARGGPWLEAAVVDDPRFSANFYYLFDGPAHWEPVEIVGFDSTGERLFRRTRP